MIKVLWIYYHFCNKFYNDILEIYIKTRDENYKKKILYMI